MVDRTARRRTLAALLISSLVSVALVLGVLFVSSAIGDARRERAKMRTRLANLEIEFKARTGQEPRPFETPTTTTTAPTVIPSTSPPANRPPSTAPATPAARSARPTASQPSPSSTAGPGPPQPPPPTTTTTTTTTACVAVVLGRCAIPPPAQP